jgi:PAS domain S-box-containing protein/putative nucleotidyltransferase with HDIG domain
MSAEALDHAFHELGVHQIELEMQNEELRRIRDELDISQARYFDFYDMAPVGYCTVRGSGLIDQVNLTAAALFGMDRALLVQQEITHFILPDDQDIFYLMRQRIIETREPQSCELRFVKQDGTQFWAHLDALAVPGDGGTPSLRVVMTDINERMLGNKALAAANKELAYQGEEKEKRAAELLVANQEIQRYIAELETAFMSTVQVVTTLSEMRDPYTAGHERKVAELAVAIGAELGFSVLQQEGLRVAGYLHDVGKITIPAEILAKPGKLSWIEHRLIQEHPQSGYGVLKNVKFPWKIAEVVLQHHERMDGSGYPKGLKGEVILLEARILAVADVVEAMSSHRPYRPALGIEAALTEIESRRGTFFDTSVVDACLRLFRENNYVIPT